MEPKKTTNGTPLTKKWWVGTPGPASGLRPARRRRDWWAVKSPSGVAAAASIRNFGAVQPCSRASTSG